MPVESKGRHVGIQEIQIPVVVEIRNRRVGDESQTIQVKGLRPTECTIPFVEVHLGIRRIGYHDEVHITVVVEVAWSQSEHRICGCRKRQSHPWSQNGLPAVHAVAKHGQSARSRQHQVQLSVTVRVQQRHVRPSCLIRQGIANPAVARLHEPHGDQGVRRHDGEIRGGRPEIIERRRLLRRVPKAVPGTPVGRVHHEQVAQDARAGLGLGRIPAMQCGQCSIQPGPYFIGNRYEQRAHPFVTLGGFDEPAHSNQDFVQFDEQGQVFRFVFEHGLQLVHRIFIPMVRSLKPSRLGEILVPECHMGLVVTDPVGEQVHGAFPVSQGRHDIGSDGQDISILRSKIRGPVYSLGGLLEFPQFQQRQGQVRVTKGLSRHQQDHLLEGIRRAFQVVSVEVGQARVLLRQDFHPYIAGGGRIAATREDKNGQR